MSEGCVDTVAIWIVLLRWLEFWRLEFGRVGRRALASFFTSLLPFPDASSEETER